MSNLATSGNRTGSCLCGKVQYQLSGPAITSMVCHCYNCQKITGSAFAANALFKKEHFKLVSGQDTIKAYNDEEVDSGNKLKRLFCGNCGSSVYLENTTLDAMKDNVVIMTGSMDGPKDTYAPKREFYPHRKYPCVAVTKGSGKL